MSVLLVDIGNTRIKWARLEQGALQAQSALKHADLSVQSVIEKVLQPGGRSPRVLVSNVSGARMGDVVRAAVGNAWQIEAEFVTATAAAGGIRNAYPQPARLGSDRWLAMIGGHALVPGPLCVVSVGTAMTIDGLDAGGQHLGGVIVPGPDLMVASLLKNTSDIAQRAEQGSAIDALFANNTLGAIHQGAEHALAALVERAFSTLERTLGEAPQLLLTGDASGRVEHSLQVPCRVVPELVLHGLAVIAATE